MRRQDAMRGVAVAAVVVLAAVACGGSDSSGLATLEKASTTAPAIDPAEVEPVSGSTAVTQPVTETTEAGEAASEVRANSAEAEADGATAAVAFAEPADTTAEEALEIEDIAGEEPAEAGDLTDEERLLAFAECMRENGVDFPDPVVEADGTVTFGFRPGGGGGLQTGRDADLPAARDACSGMLGGLAFGPGPGGSDLIELQDRLLEFARCMRDNGVDMGDPDLSRFGPGGNDDDQPGGPFGVIEIDGDDPDLDAAFEVCQQQLPQAGGPRLGGGN